MILAIAYCHRDIDQALKLLRWIGWLSKEALNPMWRERCLLVCGRVASKLPQHEEIKAAASKIFGNVMVHVPDREDERPWPMAANFMFQEALLYVEVKVNDDMLWLEPDAIPIKPKWFSELRAEWEEVARPAGKKFMGALVPNPRHTSGVAIYGRDWRTYAPKLINISGGIAWDVNSADQVLPLAHFTEKIVHKFGRRRPFTPTLEMIPPGTVIFHQDKKGLLIDLLDMRDYGGMAMRENVSGTMTSAVRFFHTENASRPLKASGLELVFESYRFFAGVHKGVLQTSDPVECVVLGILANSQTSGITEIDQPTYEKHTKRKFTHTASQSIALKPSPNTIAASTTRPIEFPVIRHKLPVNVIHAVERHRSGDPNSQRIRNAFDSWIAIYKGCGQIRPLHVWDWDYKRSSVSIGDKRALPFLKDILKAGMDANPKRDSVVMLTNDDSVLHPELPPVIGKWIEQVPAFSSFRINFLAGKPPDFGSSFEILDRPVDGDIGRDLFVFRKSWLLGNWDNIPDFLLGELEWDLVLALLVRASLGLPCSGATVGKREPLCELPMGYVWHERHERAWTKANFYNPSKQHNWKMASDWCAKNKIDYPFG